VTDAARNRAVILTGIAYALVGVVFALPTTHLRTWRFSAWGVSAAIYAAHVAHEHFKLKQTPRSGSLHVGLAAGLGAFGLAVSANIHALIVTSSHQQHMLLLIALVAWPVVVFVPAYLVARVAFNVVARF
jgi:hypothetical protein